MNKSGYPSVTITFDGMMLFHFDDSNCRCEVMFRNGDARDSKIHDHKIKVIVKKKCGNQDSEELPVPGLEHDKLCGYDDLWLYVADQGGGRDYKGPGKAERGDLYKSILQLDGPAFYIGQGVMQLKRGKYKPTMYVCDGDVGADNAKGGGKSKKRGLSRSKGGEAACYRVVDTEQGAYSFKELKYNMTAAKWKALRNSFPNLITGLDPFLRWVNVTIDLEPGQNLALMGESNDGTAHPFPQLITNYHESDAYWIHIKYTDSSSPYSLEDCKGMGHHCEAFEYNGRPLYPLYSVFSPKNGLDKEPIAPWEPQVRSSDVPCCLSACVSQYEPVN